MKQKKILLIEDEAGLVLTIGDRLKAEGYYIDYSMNGIEGEKKALAEQWDLVLLDLMLPQKDGLSICKTLRQSGFTSPIFMLTAKGETTDKVTGLKIGADDYLSKPFEMVELLARIEALLRRTENSASTISLVDTYVLSPEVSIHLKKGIILNNKNQIPLSAQEIKIIEYFIKHADTIISRDELLDSVWGYDSDITTRTIDVHIARLRQKLEDSNNKENFIQTIRGIGYKFNPLL